jgi:hypothetical protein
MPQEKYKPEQVVNMLRQVEVLLGNGKTTPQACKEVGIHIQTYYRWPWHEETATTGHCGGAGMLGRVQAKEETGDAMTSRRPFGRGRSATRISVKPFCARPSSASSTATLRPARLSYATMSTQQSGFRTLRNAPRFPPRA